MNMYPPPAQRPSRSLTVSATRRLAFISLLGLFTLLVMPAFGQSWYGQCAESEGCDSTFAHDSVGINLGFWIPDCTPTPPPTKHCWVTVWMGNRSCQGRCELFIDSIRIDSASECACSPWDFFEAVISLAILNMPTNLDTVTCIPPEDSCTSVVRVHMASCMTNYDGMLLPCPGAACCFVDYEVCKNPAGSPNIRRVSFTSSTPPCPDEGEIPLTVNPPGVGCYPVCEYMAW